MEYERERTKLEKELARADARLQAEKEKIKQLKRIKRQTEIVIKEKAEKWHRFSLAYDDRQAGYTGEMAVARAYLRSLPFAEALALIRPHAGSPGMSFVDAELAAVQAELDELTAKGREILLARARKAYEAERDSWEEWRSKNPDRNDWRTKPASKMQLKLIERIVIYREIEERPGKLNRGEAHDWIQEHEGNPRFGPGRGSSQGDLL